MSNEVAIKEDDFTSSLMQIENTQKMCKMLMGVPHYAKLGMDGIFAIIQKANTVGISPLEAVGGSMYYVNGKVELSANSMNYLIRRAGHSITKDPKSDTKICILHGKRKDNGDTWTCSFSIDDAKKAGIYKNVWEKYAEDMLFARALTRLARQLFPDVIKGCYVEGEVRDGIIDNPRQSPTVQETEFEEIKTSGIGKEKGDELFNLLKNTGDDYQEKVWATLHKQGLYSLDQVNEETYERIKKAALLNVKPLYKEEEEETEVDFIKEMPLPK